MKSPSWEYCSSIYFPRKHCTIYRDDDLGVQLQVIVKRHWGVLPTRETHRYFIDGVNRVFRSNADLVEALEIRNVEQPVLRLPADRKGTVSYRR